jgi:hypothetical protein
MREFRGSTETAIPQMPVRLTNLGIGNGKVEARDAKLLRHSCAQPASKEYRHRIRMRIVFVLGVVPSALVWLPRLCSFQEI